MNDPAPHALQLKKKAVCAAEKKARSLLKRCSICPRKCGVNRLNGKKGFCRAVFNPSIYSFAPHHGEEPVLSGSKGSGTIFFTHCNMKCVYCQNYYFSQLDNGEEVSIERLAGIMLYLQKIGCHNINFVSPTHYVPQILLSLKIALDQGLHIPLVYNTGGYDLEETIDLFDGIIDIYLPDMRYADDAMAEKYSIAPHYAAYNKNAVLAMHKQIGNLIIDKGGIAQKGLIVRLLALPGEISGTKKSLRFISKKISSDTFISLMSQYYPTFKAYDYASLARGVSAGEYNEVVTEASRLNLRNGWIQQGPADLNSEFFGPNIKPQRPVGEQ